MSDVIYTCDDGIQDILNTYLGLNTVARYQLIQSGKLRLFSNNIVVSKATMIGDLTESAFPGYGAVSLAGGVWGAVSIAGHVAQSTALAAVSFVCTGGGSSEQAYGAYVTDASGAYLLCCWNFASGPYTIVNAGDSVSTTPTLSEQSLN